jgi:hypothetical protein
MSSTGMQIGYRPQVAEEPCKTEPLHLADGAEFCCMRPVRSVGNRRFDHQQHWWEAKPGLFGWAERVRIQWSA